MIIDTPRNRHYGHFYGFDAVDNSRPVLIVHGNCQAESLRVLLEGHYGDRINAIRMVPAHEMIADDVESLRHLLARASYVVTQPIINDYRGIPVGSAQLIEAAPQARTAIVPVLRWAGLHPAQVIVRSAAGEPPIVPYHDLRTIAEYAEGRRLRMTPVAAQGLRDLSLQELQRRIAAHHAVPVDSVFTQPGRRTTYVINHPTNDVLAEVAHEIARHLGLGEPRDFDPGRVLLGSIIAPIDPYAAQIAGLEPPVDDVWQVHGVPVSNEELVDAHREWYRAHPEALQAAVARHAGALTILREGQ